MIHFDYLLNHQRIMKGSVRGGHYFIAAATSVERAVHPTMPF